MIVVEDTPTGIAVDVSTEAHQGPKSFVPFLLSSSEARALAAVLTMETNS